MSYQQLIKAAEDYIGSKGGASSSGRAIAEHLEGLMQSEKIEQHPRTVIYSYLSRAANHDEASRIVSGGPHGGYSIETVVSNADEAPAAVPTSSANQVGGNRHEKHLYPLVRAWLEANEYTSADVSALKAGGQWGNPDLIGVSYVEILGTSEIELVSVEAKTSDANWERFIFEAVSHKRFTNRSWYCYRTSTPYPALPKNMAYYAERYRVGIIQIYLSDQDYDNLAANGEASAEYLDRVQERVRALYEPVPLQEKRAFLDRAGMTLQMQVGRLI